MASSLCSYNKEQNLCHGLMVWLLPTSPTSQLNLPVAICNPAMADLLSVSKMYHASSNPSPTKIFIYYLFCWGHMVPHSHS